jgi:hypothetical protein
MGVEKCSHEVRLAPPDPKSRTAGPGRWHHACGGPLAVTLLVRLEILSALSTDTVGMAVATRAANACAALPQFNNTSSTPALPRDSGRRDARMGKTSCHSRCVQFDSCWAE